MRIGEVAKNFGLGKETIRYYREKGILSPLQKENGYFEYTTDDLALLFQIRNSKRIVSILQDSSQGFLDEVPTSAEDSVRLAIDVIQRIDETIAKLSQHRQYLSRRLSYRESLMRESGLIQRAENATGLHFLTEDQFEQNRALVKRLLDCPPTYQSVVIPREDYLRPSPILRPRYALGFTEANYRQTGYYADLDLSPLQAVPSGETALRFTLRLPTLETIERAAFAPVDRLMAEAHLQLIAPVTSIILGAASGQNRRFDVLFRFLVRPECA